MDKGALLALINDGLAGALLIAGVCLGSVVALKAAHFVTLGLIGTGFRS